MVSVVSTFASLLWLLIQKGCAVGLCSSSGVVPHSTSYLCRAGNKESMTSGVFHTLSILFSFLAVALPPSFMRAIVKRGTLRVACDGWKLTWEFINLCILLILLTGLECWSGKEIPFFALFPDLLSFSIPPLWLTYNLNQMQSRSPWQKEFLQSPEAITVH